MTRPTAYLRRIAEPARRLIRRRVGAPSPAVRMYGALGVDNRPLIFPVEKLVVSWSPKAACTHVVAWFFRHQGLLKAAVYYDPWPHRFRSRVYYDTKTYHDAAEAVTRSGGAGWSLLRVTRDPDARMVSIFRHAARSPALWEPIQQRLGIDVRGDGLSLRDFDRFLAGERLLADGEVDIHFRVQAHPSWDMAFERVITLNIDTDALEPGLAEIEAEFSLRRAGAGGRPSVGTARLMQAAAPTRYARTAEYTGDDPIEEHRFQRSETDAFPKDALLASPLLQEMTRRHHAADIGRVATGDTAGRLFAGHARAERAKRRG